MHLNSINKLDSNIKIKYSKLTKTEIENLNNCISSLRNNNFYLKEIDYLSKYAIFSNNVINLLTDFEYPWVLMEVFGEEIYKNNISVNKNGKYTLLDLGANRGYASLYFAQQDYIRDIFSFELVPQTYKYFIKNINLNPKYKYKIHSYNFGLSDEENELKIMVLQNKDACNTINQKFIDIFMPEERGKGIPQIVKVKKASNILKQIVEKNDINQIILKIDVEGAEYSIINDLVINYPLIFEKIELIIGETHLGFDQFYNKIKIYDYKINKLHTDNCITCSFEVQKVISKNL